MTKLERFEELCVEHPCLKTAVDLLKAIESHGKQAVIAGGAVRDLLLGQAPYDVDIASNMPSDEVCSLFAAHDLGQSRDFGTVCVVKDCLTFEVTEFRADGEYSDGRRPDSVKFVNSFEEDAKRRDLTINALGLDARGNIIDHVGGVQDLENGIVRTVGHPHDRFNEDKLRPLRAIRFAARYGFDIDYDTQEAIRAFAGDIMSADIRSEGVAPERVKAELFKMAKEGVSLAVSIEWMDELGLLEHILPEIAALKGLPHGKKHHPEGDPFEHTLAACAASESTDELTNVAVLLHDVGKAVTYKERDGRHTYYSHDKEGADTIRDKIVPRFKMSKHERNALTFAASQHMRFHVIEKMRPSKIIKLMTSPHWDVLKHVSFCDDVCRIGAFDQAAWDRKEALIARVAELIKPGSKINSLLGAFDGNRIAAEAGRKPGPWMSKAVHAVKSAIHDGKATTEEQVIRICRSFAV